MTTKDAVIKIKLYILENQPKNDKRIYEKLIEKPKPQRQD